MNQKTILIVDGDEKVVETLSRILRKSGYSTDIAHTAKEAFTKTLYHPYVAAIIELDLPTGDGAELLLKLSTYSSALVKIVLTNNPDILLKTEQNNADAYLVKPVNPENLVLLLEEKLGKSDL